MSYRKMCRKPFRSGWGDLVHLVSWVCHVYLIRRTRETRQPRAPDRLPLNRHPLTLGSGTLLSINPPFPKYLALRFELYPSSSVPSVASLCNAPWAACFTLNAERRTMLGAYVRNIFLCVCPFLFLLCSCARPARYIIITEDSANVTWENPDQRYICLARQDAGKSIGLMALRTNSDIQKYELRREGGQDPVESVLYYLVREEYMKTGELMSQYEDSIPKYLRLLLKADLASEGGENGLQVNQLVSRYQEAFEAQPCDISRAIIQLRIRQLRYRR